MNRANKLDSLAQVAKCWFNILDNIYTCYIIALNLLMKLNVE